MSPRARQSWLVLLVAWVLSTAYMASYINRGWVPHDEGALAQSAERVLSRELPHRNFDEVYTGGLSYLNAFGFQHLGISLASLRMILFGFFVAWVPAVYYVAARFASPIAAGGTTLLAVAWSVPNYSAAVPSWYNLFFAVFGMAALLRYLETESRGWLVLAGVCGGLSFLAKLSGLYYVAAVLLFLAFREQCLTRLEQGATRKRGRAYAIFIGIALLLFVFLVVAVLRSRLRLAELIHFLLPQVTLAMLLLWRESHGLSGSNRKRFGTLFRMLVPFGLGVAAPIAVYLIPYVLTGSLGAFLRGVFLLPTRRLIFASLEPSGNMQPLLCLAAVLVTAMYTRFPVHWFSKAVLMLALASVLTTAVRSATVYQYIWNSVVLLIPFTVVLGAILLKDWPGKNGRSFLWQQQVMLLLCVVGVCSLVQFPFAAQIYFCYVAPLLALALLGVVSQRVAAARFLLGSLLSFYLLFAALWVTPSFIYAMGYRYQPDPETRRLALQRAGGLRVTPSEAQEYERLIPLVQDHAAGEYIYAAPDCPEVYFLSGLRNPTRNLFDFLDDPAGRTARILSTLETHHVKVVAILTQPAFSGPLEPDLRAALIERFPDSVSVGRFEVRWRP